MGALYMRLVARPGPDFGPSVHRTFDLYDFLKLSNRLHAPTQSPRDCGIAYTGPAPRRSTSEPPVPPAVSAARIRAALKT